MGEKAEGRNEKREKVFMSTKRAKTSKVLNFTCRTCGNNPAISKIFHQHDIEMKLADAKHRGIIDGETLIKLLDYFIIQEKEDDEN
jgi:hypothetical protein